MVSFVAYIRICKGDTIGTKIFLKDLCLPFRWSRKLTEEKEGSCFRCWFYAVEVLVFQLF